MVKNKNGHNLLKSYRSRKISLNHRVLPLFSPIVHLKRSNHSVMVVGLLSRFRLTVAQVVRIPKLALFKITLQDAANVKLITSYYVKCARILTQNRQVKMILKKTNHSTSYVVIFTFYQYY